jgi:membrane fusion protein
MSDLFRQEAIDTQRERLWGDVILIQPISFYLITAAVLVIVVIAALFLMFGEYSRRENVLGYLEPDQGLVKVYAEQPGVMTNIHAREGDVVQSGDLLFTISTQRNTNEAGDVDALILSELEKARRNLEDQMIQQEKLDILESQNIDQRIAGLKEELGHLDQEVKLRQRKYQVASEKIINVSDLVKKKHLSTIQFKDMQEQKLAAQLQLEESLRILANQRNRYNELSNKKEKLPVEAALRMASLDQSLSEIHRNLEEAKARRVYSIRAPMTGRITSLHAWQGQSIRANALLMAIVPQDAVFEAHLFVPTRAIGFVYTGQQVLLQYEAFPYQRFGLHKGEITKVTENIISPMELPVPVNLEEPVYRVTVRPEKQSVSAYGRNLQLQAGMLLKADIILDSRSLGEWLLDPLYSLTGRI